MRASSLPLDHSGLGVLPREECLRRLRAARVGRVALIDQGEPVILPVNHAMAGTLYLGGYGGHARSRGCWNTVEDVQPSWRSIPLYRLNCIGVRQRYVAGPPPLYAGIAHSIVRSEIPAVTLDINLS